MTAALEPALRDALAELGDDLLEVGSRPGAPAEVAYARVPPGRWREAVGLVVERAGAGWLDWLGAVDEEERVDLLVCLRAPDGPSAGAVALLATGLPPDAPEVDSLVPLLPGAAWHEREAHEMYAVGFRGHPDLRPLLLPPGFEGHPLRKDFVLASRVAREWPGEHEPSGRTRRRALPPGVPEPGTWGGA
ncbi:NADH:ubiquinone oxidoreductase subunit C [Motilibacter rhizosphaerae]|uniref:NADH-quinone oxidoreductase n=1 Tax=Motilibacter rhizosphaerae TaxID=598652 RepID=A0A4Q7N9Y5_9ACTN|nr:NADH-quinone oxidoreductase subunit C [Motilibacter rhizosphaerae]RZS78992.1 NADH:ubiquinone oxidoreductase subunit C [Motilibacter rhizosphaerae]